jgi:hypothetical protein
MQPVLVAAMCAMLFGILAVFPCIVCQDARSTRGSQSVEIRGSGVELACILPLTASFALLDRPITPLLFDIYSDHVRAA